MPLITTPWHAVDHLTSDKAITAYLDACLEEGDPKLVAAALGDIASAKGITDLATRTGLTADTLDRALSAKGDPELSVVLKIVAALDLQLMARHRAVAM